jgi:hypothetical protein
MVNAASQRTPISTRLLLVTPFDAMDDPGTNR